MCNEQLETYEKAIQNAKTEEARQQARTNYEEALAREIVRLDEKYKLYSERLKQTKQKFMEHTTRKIIVVGAKKVEYTSTDTFGKPSAADALAKFGIENLIKAKALTVSAAEHVRRALEMIDQPAVKKLFPSQAPVKAVSVSNV